MKYKLTNGSYNNERDIGIYNSQKEANAAMVQELHSKGIEPYYYRSWWEPETDKMVVDYGSHSNFYYITSIKEN